MEGASKKFNGPYYEGVLPWNGVWKEARRCLVTEDFQMFERARTEGLPTAMEDGRRKNIDRKERICECGRGVETTEHMIERCKLHVEERRECKQRLRDLGCEDNNIWNVIKKDGLP